MIFDNRLKFAKNLACLIIKKNNKKKQEKLVKKYSL